MRSSWERLFVYCAQLYIIHCIAIHQNFRNFLASKDRQGFISVEIDDDDDCLDLIIVE